MSTSSAPLWQASRGLGVRDVPRSGVQAAGGQVGRKGEASRDGCSDQEGSLRATSHHPLCSSVLAPDPWSLFLQV